MTWTVADVMATDTVAVEHAAELVASAVATTTADTTLANAASLMFQLKAQMLPVVDLENRAVGTISRKRLLRVFLRSDELIRREIVWFLRTSAARGIHVDVEVTGGLVSLRGEGETLSLLESLKGRIAGVPGVVGVRIEPIQALNVQRSGASANRVRA